MLVAMLYIKYSANSLERARQGLDSLAFCQDGTDPLLWDPVHCELHFTKYLLLVCCTPHLSCWLDGQATIWKDEQCSHNIWRCNLVWLESISTINIQKHIWGSICRIWFREKQWQMSVYNRLLTCLQEYFSMTWFKILGKVSLGWWCLPGDNTDLGHLEKEMAHTEDMPDGTKMDQTGKGD